MMQPIFTGRTIVNVDTVKAHVRLEGYDGDNDMLARLVDAAAMWVCNYIRLQYYTGEFSPVTVPATEGGNWEMLTPLAVTTEMLVAHWYNQREAVAGVSLAAVPYTLEALLKPYVRAAGQSTM